MKGVYGVALRGTQALTVEVEVEITGGLFSMTVVGLPDAAVREARERVRAALRNVSIGLRGRIAINLAPADIPKEGALLDLPMAVALLLAVRGRKSGGAIFLGELALDGRLRGVRGAVPAALLARELDLPLFVPKDNAREVALVKGVRAYAATTLEEVGCHLQGTRLLEPVAPHRIVQARSASDINFSDIKGQYEAKRALEIAAAGRHNVLLIGAPGAGKTMLARALKGILPPMSDEELMEVLLVRSTVGVPLAADLERPFRSVHHKTTAVAICGGSSSLRPGEVSLATRGVLFLDEFPEFPSDVLEGLRQPLEEGRVVVARASGKVTYPARFTLVAACNPCPCGFRGDPGGKCRCDDGVMRRYLRKFSGPILDRIDLYVWVPRLLPHELLSFRRGEEQGEGSDAVLARVCAARELQLERWRKIGCLSNADVPERALHEHSPLGPAAGRFLESAMTRMEISGRGFVRVLRVARTIADLAGGGPISEQHVAEALSYRERLTLAYTEVP